MANLIGYLRGLHLPAIILNLSEWLRTIYCLKKKIGTTKTSDKSSGELEIWLQVYNEFGEECRT